MKNGTLKDRTFSSIAWSSSIQSTSQVINFCLGIVLARLLTPEDFGLMATMLAFISVAQLFSDFGLSAGLIQKDTVTKEESFSCIILNLLIGASIALTVTLLNKQVANFYNEERLEIIVLAIAPLFFITSLCSVPQALLSRELAHKRISLIDLTSVILGTISAVILAYYEFGIWSLIVQQYVYCSLRMFFLITSTNLSWAKFDYSSVRSIFGFSASVFLTRLIQTIAQQTDKVLIGKYLGTQQLGFYSRAFHLTTFPINNVTRVVNNVMFPALSKIKHDANKVTTIYLRVVGYIAVLTFPMLSGFAYLSEEIVYLLLGEKWLPMHHYFMFFSIVCMLSTIGQMSTSFFLSQGKAGLHLKLNLFTQSAKILLLLIGVNWGAIGILFAFAGATILSFSSTIYLLAKFLSFHPKDFINALAKTVFITATMIVLLFTLDFFINLNGALTILISNSCAGFVIYLALNLLLKNKPFFELTGLIFSKFVKKSRTQAL